MPLSVFSVIFIYIFLGFGTDAEAQDYQRPDIFALLTGTLRTFQRAGCDNDIVTLKCPAGTSISVQIAQYGKSASSKGLCPKSTATSISTTTNDDPDISEPTDCLLPDSIQTVIEACQKKRQCKFQTSPTTFGGDPCPRVPKYVEVAYKCRPYEFRSKVACENERIQLKCNPHSRVAVYSASYGRTQYESIQCPQAQGVPEETCLASYATETVMQLCHGKRSCDLAADVGSFGSPCKPQSRTYLKVVYTCVPRRVLKDQYEGVLEPDEKNYNPNEGFDEFDNYDTENEHIRESAASPPISQLDNASKDNLTKNAEDTASQDKSHALGFEINQRYLIYIGIGVTAAVLLLISSLISRVLIKKHRTEKETTFYATSISDHTLANGFTDDISEVDADIDLQTTLPMSIPSVTVHPVPMGTIAEVVRYPEYPEYPHMHSHSHTFRGSPRGILETEIMPTRPMRDASTSQYYYG
ncbi:protein eva-1 isoform X2 [Dendroctonus ponderosae]|uniref:protein eva-1 isoform X2 n=1 Tax=Dendroctonus ponderosae TaxID=77166 RepID=UPI0020355EF1|nr:protein eva-1 isoform X2 [Dendroctonus ponderosae]